LSLLQYNQSVIQSIIIYKAPYITSKSEAHRLNTEFTLTVGNNVQFSF